MSYQRVIIEGNLGKDPEIEGEGDKVRTKFTVAVNEKRGGEEKAEWFNCVCFGKTAENAAKYLSKGRAAIVEGKLNTRQYEKDGQTRYFTELVADRVVFLSDGKGEGQQQQRMSGGSRKSTPPAADAPPSNQFVDDDLPF